MREEYTDEEYKKVKRKMNLDTWLYRLSWIAIFAVAFYVRGL